MKARPLFILAGMCNGEFCVRERSRETWDWNFITGGCRPLAAPRQATSEDTNVIGEICDRERDNAQIIERHRRVEWRNDPAIAFRNDTKWRKVNPSYPIHRRNDGLPDHWH